MLMFQCLSYCPVVRGDDCPTEILKEEGVTLAHGFKGISTCLLLQGMQNGENSSWWQECGRSLFSGSEQGTENTGWNQR